MCAGVYMCVYVCACQYVGVRVRVHPYVCMYVYIYIYIYIIWYIYIYICINVYIYIYTYLHAHAPTYTKYMRLFMHGYYDMCVCACVYMLQALLLERWHESAAVLNASLAHGEQVLNA